MSVPLATLRRHSQLVWLHDSLGAPQPQPPPPPPSPGKAPRVARGADQLDPRRGRRLAFRDLDQAGHWLQHWRIDPAALMALRSALQRGEPSAPVYAWSDAHVLEQLASRLARGAIVAIESLAPPSPAVLPAVAAPPVAVEPPAMSLAQLLAPVPTPPPALLPVLEEVQIEGAEVLPEIDQSLEQVDLSLGEINLAPESLEPTPSKVPDIGTAMAEAGASVQADIDKL